MPALDDLILYGCPVSLYTGKARSYLRKAGLKFTERLQSHPAYGDRIFPTIGRFVIPVLETTDGTIVQDTSDIIDFLERQSAAPFGAYPTTPIQKIVALIFELFGDEGLLRPAMHYRWNYPEENKHFIAMEFGRAVKPNATEAEATQIGEMGMSKMQAYLPGLGITPETIPAIEQSYEELLHLLDAHFLAHPYLLGGKPTIGDFGLYAPLYAHLARDPAPSMLMKRRAQRVWRWVERMTVADADMPEFPDYNSTLLADDAVPETLLPVLGFIGRTYLPELKALVVFLNGYLEKNQNIESGSPVITDKNARVLGGFEVTIGETRFALAGRHFSIWMLQRVQDAFAALSEKDQQNVRTFLGTTGLESILEMRTSRRIERVQYLEVWQ